MACDRDDAAHRHGAVEALAKEHKPKLIIAGGSAYARFWDFERFREICRSRSAPISWSTSPISPGSVAGGAHPSPFPHAHVVTTTTHKTLRGPRGGMILTNDEELAKKINSAIFPGLQGGPLMHVIAAKAVAFDEALRPEFSSTRSASSRTPRPWPTTLRRGRLRARHRRHRQPSHARRPAPKSLTGKAAEAALGPRPHHLQQERHPLRPAEADGHVRHPPRLAGRHLARLRDGEFGKVGDLIVETLDGLAANGESGNAATEAKVREDVKELTRRFPIY